MRDGAPRVESSSGSPTGSFPVRRAVPKRSPSMLAACGACGNVASRHQRHILYLHRGGYVAVWAGLCRDLTWRLATLCGVCALGVKYRLAPEHPFPTALDDAAAAYRWLLAKGVDPKRRTGRRDQPQRATMPAAVVHSRLRSFAPSGTPRELGEARIPGLLVPLP
jgi:acetyl esterase/lipase